MKAVDPIKDVQKIREIKQKLRASNSRDYLLFTMGINLALREGSLYLKNGRFLYGEKINILHPRVKSFNEVTKIEAVDKKPGLKHNKP